jgi:hypothetical protein
MEVDMFTSKNLRSAMILTLATCCALTTWTDALARPTGFIKTTIPLNAPPVGLAFDGGGVLYALEGAASDSNQATLRRVLADGTLDEGYTVSVTGDDVDHFYVGGMTYDPIGERLLVTDNTIDGRLYAVDAAGDQETIATGIAGIAGVAVRASGEIFVSTAPFGEDGAVLQVDRISGGTTPVLTSLGFGAGLAFDLNGDLIVQDADSDIFLGRLQRVPITEGPGGLEFGSPVPLLSGMQSSAGVAVDSEGDIFTTGSGGLFRMDGAPLAELPFDDNESPFQFATAISFDASLGPFQGFRGPDGGRLAYMADFGFAGQDSYITLLTPAQLGDYNGDGIVDDADYALWLETYGSTDELPADGNLDGSTSAADYVAWRKFAPQMNELLSATTEFSVPEPATTSAIAVSLMLLVLYRQRRWPRTAAGFGPMSTRRITRVPR